MDHRLSLIGLPPFDARSVPELAMAAGIIIVALTLAWVMQRTLGQRLTAFVHGDDTTPHGPLTQRAGVLLAASTFAVLVGAAAALWPWSPYGALLLTVAIAAGLASIARQISLGVRLGTQVAWIAAVSVFVAIIAGNLHGVTLIADRLDSYGFSAGRMRFSLLSIITIIATLIILFAAVRIGNRAVRRATMSADSLDDTQRLLVQKIAGIGIIIIAFFVGIDLIGIDVTAFAVFSGALGLAVGFGLQKTFGNLIAGIILLMDRSIKPGDVIVVGDSFGWVNKIGVRAVSVITRDGKEHLIPNENLMTQEVENWSYSSKDVRVRIPIGVAYEADLAQAQALMLEAARESPRVLDTPPPNVWLTAFGDSSVDHELLVWINDPEGGVGNVRSDVLNRVWAKVKQAGVGIPYPQRDIHIKSGIVPTK